MAVTHRGTHVPSHTDTYTTVRERHTHTEISVKEGTVLAIQGTRAAAGFVLNEFH